jgi:hypothetical protein
VALLAAVVRDLAVRWRTFRQDRFALVLLAILGLVSFLVFYARLRTTIEARLPANSVFGADTRLLQNPVDTRTYRLGYKYAKHPLVSVPFIAVVKAARAVGMDGRTAAAAYLAAVAAAAVLLLNALLLLHGAPTLWAFVSTLLAFSLFSAVTIFSVPELYSSVSVVTLLAIILLPEIARAAGERSRDAAVLAGLAGIGLALANLTAMAFLLVFAFTAWPLFRGARRRLVHAAVVPMGIALGFTFAANAVLQAAGQGWVVAQTTRWASLQHFFDARVLGSYALDFFTFSTVAPTARIVCEYGTAQLAGFVGSPLRVLLWGGLTALVLAGLWGGIRNPRTRYFIAGTAATIGVFAVFHLYFDPREVLLFASEWVPLLVAIGAIGSRPRAAHYVAVVVLLVLAVAVNFPPLDAERLAGLVTCGE